jgi:hypothetical protein
VNTVTAWENIIITWTRKEISCLIPRSIFKSTVFAVIVAFVLTVAVARAVSLYSPRFHVDLYPGYRTHHYVYGIFLLAISGYLALLFKSPRATPWISLLYGLGLGLTFDEFGFWVTVNAGRGVRWNTNGLLLIAILFVALTAGPVIFRKLRRPSLPDAAQQSAEAAGSLTRDGA